MRHRPNQINKAPLKFENSTDRNAITFPGDQTFIPSRKGKIRSAKNQPVRTSGDHRGKRNRKSQKLRESVEKKERYQRNLRNKKRQALLTIANPRLPCNESRHPSPSPTLMHPHPRSPVVPRIIIYQQRETWGPYWADARQTKRPVKAYGPGPILSSLPSPFPL